MIMIMDGGLKSIDKCLYESATIDGAGKLKQAMVVSMPCLKPKIGPSVVITIFTTFQTFDVIGHLARPEVGAVLVTPDGVELPVKAQGWKEDED